MLPSAVAGGKTQKWLGGATHLQASPLLPDIQKHVLRTPIKTGHERALKQMRAQPRVRTA